MHYLRLMVAAALSTAVLFSGTSARAAPLFDFLPATPPDVTGTFIPEQLTLGYTFEVTGGGISVDGIGIFDFGSDGLASAHEVALWDMNKNFVIAPLKLTPGPPPSNSEESVSHLGSYIYVDISPLPLGPGEYRLGVSYLPSNGNKDVAVNMPPLPIRQNAGNVMYLEGVFGFGATGIQGINVTFPDMFADVPGREIDYFGPALRISATIPEPQTLLLLIIGIVGIGGNLRQRSRLGDSIPA